MSPPRDAVAGFATDLSGLPSITRPGDHAVAEQLVLARLHLIYFWRHRRRLNLVNPTLFTEFVQHRKFFDRSGRLAPLADKVAVKSFVERRLGPGWTIPTLWQGLELPPSPRWHFPFVVKSRHGSNQTAFVRTGRENWAAIRRNARRWAGSTYGTWLDERLYEAIPKGLLVEPFLGVRGVLPLDYKFYVFGGRVEFIQVHLERETAHRWIVFDRSWRRASSPTADPDPRAPLHLAAMIEAAEELARGLDFVRVDMYEVGGRALFGEMTFYPGSGLDPFDPPELDVRMGAFWRRAKAAQQFQPLQ